MEHRLVGGGHTYFKDQCLISGPGSIQALWLIERALIVEDGASELELARPIHCPIARQVVLALEAAHSQVAGGHLHLPHIHAASPHRDGDHPIIF